MISEPDTLTKSYIYSPYLIVRVEIRRVVLKTTLFLWKKKILIVC